MISVLRDLVVLRARHACEYCKTPQSARRLTFHIDHIIARQHGGETLEANLALACGHCNRHKGTNLSGIDPETGSVVSLFNPRTDRWNEYFSVEAAYIIGLTATGRATVHLMKMNAPDEVAARSELLASRGRLTID